MPDQTKIMNSIAREMNYLLDEESNASEISRKADNITADASYREGESLKEYDGRKRR